MKIAKNLKTLRLKLNLSQNQFAKLLGVTKSFISHCESGRRTPSYSIAQKMNSLADVAKINFKLSYIFEKPEIEKINPDDLVFIE